MQGTPFLRFIHSSCKAISLHGVILGKPASRFGTWKVLDRCVLFPKVCTRTNTNAFSSVSRVKLVNKPYQSLLPSHSSCINTSRLTVRRISTKGEFCGTKTEQRFRQRDSIPSSYSLIYRTDFPNYLVCCQIFVCLSVGAIITAAVTWLIESEEYRNEKQLKRKDTLMQAHEDSEQVFKESRLGEALDYVKKKYELEDLASTPKPLDMLDEGPVPFVVMGSILVVFAAALFRIQRILPVRIYKKTTSNHCVAIYYGHIIPGRLTHSEFLAGTVKPMIGKIEFLNLNRFKDGSGRQIIFMEQFFRHPADYNTLMGYEEFAEDIVRESMRKPRRPS